MNPARYAQPYGQAKAQVFKAKGPVLEQPSGRSMRRVAILGAERGSSRFLGSAFAFGRLFIMPRCLPAKQARKLAQLVGVSRRP